MNWTNKVNYQDTSKTGKPWTVISPSAMHTREGIESVVDTFQLEMPLKTLPKGFEADVQDNVQISFGSITQPSDVHFDGITSDITLDVSERGKKLTIKGNNRFEYLMGYQRPTAMTNTTAFSAASLLITQVNDANDANPDWVNIGWNSDNTVTTNVFNFYRTYKPVYQHIEELAKKEFTGLGNFIYYINKDKEFVFKDAGYNPSGTITEGKDIITYKVQKASYDVVNAAIINGGEDFGGNPIYRFVCNYNSVGKLGFKWKYFEDMKIAEMLKKESGVTKNNDYPYGNPDDYSGGNAQFREDAGTIIKNIWKSKIMLLSLPRWRVDMTVRPNVDHILGDVYNLVIPSIGWDVGKSLRLRERSQDSGKNGWVTNLHFEEDEKTAGL